MACRAFIATAGSSPDTLTFSIWLSPADCTWVHSAVAGGAFTVRSCSPKTASFGSAASAGSAHAACADGRSPVALYQVTWVFAAAR